MKIRATAEYRRWLDELKDGRGRARIQARIERLAMGNPGDHRHLKSGVSELRIPTGPGYRVYYTLRDGVVIVLLCGGDKSTQSRDIARAQHMATLI